MNLLDIRFFYLWDSCFPPLMKVKIFLSVFILCLIYSINMKKIQYYNLQLIFYTIIIFCFLPSSKRIYIFCQYKRKFIFMVYHTTILKYLFRIAKKQGYGASTPRPEALTCEAFFEPPEPSRTFPQIILSQMMPYILSIIDRAFLYFALI